MKIHPSLRIVMRLIGVAVIAWAALHPAADAVPAAQGAAGTSAASAAGGA